MIVFLLLIGLVPIHGMRWQDCQSKVGPGFKLFDLDKLKFDLDKADLDEEFGHVQAGLDSYMRTLQFKWGLLTDPKHGYESILDGLKRELERRKQYNADNLAHIVSYIQDVESTLIYLQDSTAQQSSHWAKRLELEDLHRKAQTDRSKLFADYNRDFSELESTKPETVNDAVLCYAMDIYTRLQTLDDPHRMAAAIVYAHKQTIDNTFQNEGWVKLLNDCIRNEKVKLTLDGLNQMENKLLGDILGVIESSNDFFD